MHMLPFPRTENSIVHCSEFGMSFTNVTQSTHVTDSDNVAKCEIQ